MKYLSFVILFCTHLRSENIQSFISFKENKGQWPKEILFGSDFSNTQFFVSEKGFRYFIYDKKEWSDLPLSADKNNLLHGHGYQVNFVGAHLNNVTTGTKQSELYNYFLGNNKGMWASNVRSYSDVLFREVYEGIDLKLYGSGLNLKYDFIVKPFFDPSSILIKYENSNGLEFKNGNLVIKTSVGEVIESKPYVYQIINGEKIVVKCNYTLLENDLVGFNFPNGYSKNYELIIDPVVLVCSYSGTPINNINSGCTYDENGNIFTIGRAVSGYPTTVGAFQLNCTGIVNFLVSGYSASGTTKNFSTFIGGDSLDDAFCIVARNKELIIMGRSCSKNFPTTSTAFDTTLNGQTDIVLCKLNNTGSSLLASTYIGGSGPECNNFFANVTVGDFYFFGECVSDTSGNVYAITNTNSTNFPTSAGAFSTTLKGGIDACVFKMDNTLSTLMWSTFLGGNTTEDGKSIRLDGVGGVYCLGSTNSINFPTTAGCVSPTKLGGSTDYFVTHLNSTGSAVINSTYLGTTANDVACLMDLDENNNVYVSGQINNPSALVPTTGVFFNSSGYNTIFKINSSLSTLHFKTKFGNVVSGKFPYLSTTAFRVDSCHNIYISGLADNSLPTTSNAFMSFGGGIKDLYMAVFKNNCTSLSFASYYGGPQDEHSDGGISRFDHKGVLYQGFYARGGTPTTANAFSANYSGSNTEEDGFLKVDLQTHINASSSYGATIIGCPPFTPTFVSSTNTGNSYWNLGNGITSTSNTVSTTYTLLGNYNVVLVVTDTSTCNKTDTVKSLLSLVPPTDFDLGEDKYICINENLTLESNVSALSYSWSTGQNSTSATVNAPGSYSLIIDNGGCKTSDYINVILGEKDFSLVFPNIVTPNGDTKNDFIDFSKYKFEELHFTVFDRWGRIRQTIEDPYFKFEPSNFDDGTYFYVIEYRSNCTGKHNTHKGYLQVIK